MADTPSKGDEKVIDEAKKRFKRCAEWESTARARYLDDVRFCEGDSDNLYQWDKLVWSDRVNNKKPALTINKTRQHCLQIVNDQRENKAQIEIRPVGDGATYDSAKIYEGLVRHVEYQSNAMEAYDAAAWHQVAGGIGYWRVLTEYVDDASFDQEIYIRRVHDPLSIYLDPDIRQYDGSDARFGFVFEDVARDQFEGEFPEWKDEIPSSNGLDELGWNDKDHVRVAEYYRKSEKPDKLFALADGTTALKSKLAKDAMTGDKPGDIVGTEAGWMPIVRVRDTTRPEIEWFKIVGTEIVDRSIWPGSFIPIVRVVGEETIIDGQLDRKGHTRALKDPNRMYNFWSSASVEYAALQGKAPWVGPMKAFEGLETFWGKANTENLPFLPYNHIDDDGRELPAPQRQNPPTAMPAALEGMKVAQMEMMMASGQYQAQMGENENAKSGVAINARQRQGDKATYHYIDHLAQAIRFTGRILIDLFPKIYDTPRIIKILAENGDQTEVNVRPDEGAPAFQQMVAGQPANAEQVKTAQNDDNLKDQVETIFNPNVGRYDVVADIGPAYATKRQEAFNAFSQMMQNNVELMKVAGDLMFKAADFPMADELAERLKRMVPPEILGEGPPPAVSQLQEQHKQIVGGLQQMISSLVQQNADKDLKLKQRDEQHDLDSYKAETSRLQAIGGVDPDVLKPIFRSWMSEMLGMDVLPEMQKHAEADQARLPEPEPETVQ